MRSVALSAKDAIEAEPDITVGEYVAANIRGKVLREIDGYEQIRDKLLVEVLAVADAKTYKLLTNRRFRKQD